MSSRFENKFEEITKQTHNSYKRLEVIPHQVHQSRFTAKAGVKEDKETREHEEDATTKEKIGDISSADPTSRTNFSDKKFLEPSAPTKYSGDALVDQGAKVASLTRGDAHFNPAGGLSMLALPLKHKGPSPHSLFFGESGEKTKKRDIGRTYHNSPSTTAPGQ